MQQGIELIVIIAILVVQLLLGVVAAFKMRRTQREFADPLSSMLSVAELLEKYSLVHAPVSISVDAPIRHYPAIARADVLLVSKGWVFHTTLYAGVYTLYQILLTRIENKYIRSAGRWQKLLLVVEVTAMLLGVFVHWAFYLVAIAVGILALGGSILLMILVDEVLREVQEIGADLLDLDEIEQIRASLLMDDIKAEVFIYPWELIGSILSFFVPNLRR